MPSSSTTVLARTEHLFVLVAGTETLVIGCGKHYRELYLCRVLLQLFDDGLSLRWKLVQDQRLKLPAAQHCFKLSARCVVVPIDDEYLAEHWLGSSAILRRGYCRNLPGLHTKTLLHGVLILTLNDEVAGVITVDDGLIL